MRVLCENQLEVVRGQQTSSVNTAMHRSKLFDSCKKQGTVPCEHTFGEQRVMMKKVYVVTVTGLLGLRISCLLRKRGNVRVGAFLAAAFDWLHGL